MSAGEDDLPPEEDDDLPPDGEEGEDEVEGEEPDAPLNTLEVEAALERVGEDTELTIAGIPLPGLYSLDQSGSGYKSQYLTEVEAGGYGADEAGDPATEEAETPDETAGEDEAAADPAPETGSETGDDSEQPPLTVKVQAAVAQETWSQLVELRTTTETFAIELGDITLDEMELTDLKRTLSGTKPYAYDATITVTEYREYTIVTNLPPGGTSPGSTTSPGGLDGLGPGGPTLDWVGGEGIEQPAGSTDITELGADNTGSEPVNAALQEAFGPGEVVYFPAGEYLLDPISLSGADWQLVGDGATLICDGVTRDWLRLAGDGWRFRNFVVEHRNGGSPLNYAQGSNWRVENFYASNPTNDHGYGGNGIAAAYWNPSTASSGATGVFDNVLLPHGTEGATTSNRSGTWFGSNNPGHLIFHRVYYGQWGHNTLYAEESAGPVTVSNSIFENTNVGVRVAGDSTIRNSRFISDGDFAGARWSDGAKVQRGLWIAQNNPRNGPVTVVGCDFLLTGPAAGPAIIEGDGGLRGTVTVEDTRIEGAGIQLRTQLEGTEIHVTGGGVQAGGGTVTNSCADGGFSGVTASGSSEGSCDRPNVTGAFPASSQGDDPGPENPLDPSGEV